MGEDDATTSGQDRRESNNYADLRECAVIWAVTIPGESPWVADALDGPLATLGKHAAHRSLQPHKFPIPEAPHVGVHVKVCLPPLSL